MAVSLGGSLRKDFSVYQADFTSCSGHGLPPLDVTTPDWTRFAMVLTEDFVLYVHGGKETGTSMSGQLNITNMIR